MKESERVENQPYFKWRLDSNIQTTLGLAATSIFTTFAGLDPIVGAMSHGRDRLTHLLLLAGLLGGSVVFQFRTTVLPLRPLCVSVILLDIAASVTRSSALSVFALIASSLFSLAASIRMRSSHWNAFHKYCESPEITPTALRKR